MRRFDTILVLNVGSFGVLSVISAGDHLSALDEGKREGLASKGGGADVTTYAYVG